MKENNRIRNAAAKIAAAILTAVMIVQPVVPVTEVQAATHTANRMLEIPVSFQTDRTYVSFTNIWNYAYVAFTIAYANENNIAPFECSGADFAPGSRVGYKVYIPASYLEDEDSMITVKGGAGVFDTETNKGLWSSDSASVMVSADGIMVYAMIDGVRGFYTLEEAAKQYDPLLDVQMEKEGDFYVVSVDAMVDIYGEGTTQYTENGVSDMENVNIKFAASVYGFSMDVPDGSVYFDDITYTSASGETLHTEDFEDTEDVISNASIAVYDGSGNKTTIKKLNVETIYDNELLTTLKSKVSVKKGKKKSLSTYVNAVSTDEVTYTSSNKKVATVNSKGVVKGKKKGTATITVTANGVKKKIKVTVK